jgi:hypothetical protein
MWEVKEERAQCDMRGYLASTLDEQAHTDRDDMRAVSAARTRMIEALDWVKDARACDRLHGSQSSAWEASTVVG